MQIKKPRNAGFENGSDRVDTLRTRQGALLDLP